MIASCSFLSLHMDFQVPLGVLPHSETSTDGMVNVLDLMNQYIPEVTTDEHNRILPL